MLTLNKELPLPELCNRIAVISSPTAAGYEDFCDQLKKNPYGLVFYTKPVSYTHLDVYKRQHLRQFTHLDSATKYLPVLIDIAPAGQIDGHPPQRMQD